jgi:BCD family chlorophyll transporter-like MFS transporter
MAQDVLLEPYGGLVLGMGVGETTRLTMFWGMGVMLSMLACGALLIPWLGHFTVLRLGLATSVTVFAGIVVCGAFGRADLFRVLVGLMGLSTGLAGAGVLTGALHYTVPERAGVLMGAWGMANLLGKALGGLLGGGVVDVIRASGGAPLAAYGAVFTVEALLLGVAFALTGKLRSSLAPESPRAGSD